MNCRCGCATISRESETVRPVFTSARAAARRASVMRFTVPRWSSWPQRPQLFSRLKYDSTSACVGSLGAGMRASSREMPEYATQQGLQLIAEGDQRQIECVAHRVANPCLVRHRLGELEIVFEDRRHARGEPAIEKRDVQLVVQRERAVVEVGAADADPLAVDNHRLRVQERRAVLVDLGARL